MPEEMPKIDCSTRRAAVRHWLQTAPGTIGLVGLLTALPANAAWEAVPSITAETGHTSNLRMSPNTRDSTLQSTVEAGVASRYFTDRTDFRGRLGASYTNYSGADETVDDTDRQYVALLLSHRAERFAFGGSIGYKKDDLLRRRFTLPPEELGGSTGSPDSDPIDVIAPDNPDEPDAVEDGLDPDLNRTGGQLTRKNFRFSAFSQARLNDRNRLRVTYRFNDRNPTQDSGVVPDPSGAADPQPEAVLVRRTKRHALGVQWARDLSENHKLLTDVEASHVETEGREDAQYYNARAIWRGKLSPLWRLEASTGVSVLDGLDDTDVGWLAGVVSSYRTPRGNLTLEARRTLEPSIFGGIEEGNRLGVVYTRALAPKWTAAISARGITSKRKRNAGNIKQEQFSLSPAVTWRFHEAMEVNASYEYRWIDREGQSSTFAEGVARAHVGTISLRYYPAGVGSR